MQGKFVVEQVNKKTTLLSGFSCIQRFDFITPSCSFISMYKFC